nr:BadF/BadG/BcrA/BcrD ATPase family protein [Pyrinomonadaceae bacterium]
MPTNPKNPLKLLTSHNLYLGVDGGGTKTHIALRNEKGEIVGEGFAGASNPLRVGVENAVENIVKAINNACDVYELSRGDIVSATLGLAGVRRGDIKKIVGDSFRKRLNLKKIQVVTDAEIALFGSTLGKAGLVIIAGTGSVCLGIDDDGKLALSGGWGPLAGDEG